MSHYVPNNTIKYIARDIYGKRKNRDFLHLRHFLSRLVTSWIKRMSIFADISSARAYNNIARAISGYPGRYPYATLDWATLYVVEMLTVREK